jgi:hypothetical protein
MTLMCKASQLPTDGLSSERCSALAKKIVSSSEFAVFFAASKFPASARASSICGAESGPPLRFSSLINARIQ